MKWVTRLCRAIAFVAFAPGSLSRTVQPVTYSYKTTNDGGYTATFQEGVHRIFDNTATVSSSTPFSVHPSVLAHHYYDRPPEMPTSFSYFANTTYTTSRPKKPAHKKNDYVPRVSYVYQKDGETTTLNYESTTEPMMRKVRIWRKGRPKNRDEIPVNEEATTESTVVNGHGTQTSEFKDEQTYDDKTEISTAKAESFFNLLSPTESLSTTTEEINDRQPKPFRISTSSLVDNSTPKSTRQHSHGGKKGIESYNRSQIRGKQRKPKDPSVTTPKFESPSTDDAEEDTDQEQLDNEDEKGENESVGKMADRRKGTTEEEVLNGGRRKDDGRRPRKPKTTPLPKYKEAYLRRPRKKTKTTASHDAGRVAGSSNRRYEKERTNYSEDSFQQTTDHPFTSTDETNIDIDRESESEPGTHHESLRYTDTEKTDVIRQDIEYPDDEDQPPEAAEEDEPRGENSELPAAKMLQKPLRYSYSADQKQSASQDHGSEKTADAKQSKGGGEKHKESHHETEGEKKNEEHESKEEYEKGKKGHSDEEERKHDHEEMKGKKKNHKTEAGHYGQQHVVAKGEKEALFGESGAHKKGHSTKGSHNVHKKNEYLKKHEFYDEHHEDDEHKKYGDYEKGHEHEKGGKYKKAHKDDNFSAGKKAKKGKYHKGHREREHKGHDNEKKNEKHHSQAKKYGDKEHHSEGKKWKYEKLNKH